MATKHVRIGFWILFATVYLGIVAMLVLSKPKIAIDTDAPERLFCALHRIGCGLAVVDNGVGSHKLDPGDFIPRSIGDKADFPARKGRLLAEQHGVSASLYRNGAFEKVFFYPVAVSQEVVIEPQSNVKPTPQIVMVPVDEEDVETLPNLSGCGDVTAERTRERQFRRMKVLFSKHGIKYAFTLRSDGSVRALPVDDLRKER